MKRLIALLLVAGLMGGVNGCSSPSVELPSDTNKVLPTVPPDKPEAAKPNRDPSRLRQQP